MKTYKTIDWSYPTSTNAKRFGRPEGCWTVSLAKPTKDRRGLDCYIVEAVAAFATHTEAVTHANAMPEPLPSWQRSLSAMQTLIPA